VGDELKEVRRRADQLRTELGASRAELADERSAAECERERAARLAEAIREMHRSLFNGNVYELILRACITITAATRGLYITTRGPDKRLRVRAAVEIDGHPGARPSEFIEALCRRVLESRDSLVCNSESDLEGLPQPSGPEESFHNFAAAPVVVLDGLDGVVLVADKLSGDFDKQDVETLISVGQDARVALENDRLRLQLQDAYLSTITALADAVEAKDPYTHGHCERVASYARQIASAMGLPEREQRVAYYGGLLHDVGKIGVSDGVLNKPGALLPEERELVRSHVRVGYDIVRKVPVLEAVADAVLFHHEWYDGTGYPDGLKGDNIPLAARIVSVADAFGAMIDKRSYKEAYGPDQARDELVRCAGSQFDPQVVETFVDLLDSGDGGLDDEPELSCAVLLDAVLMGESRQPAI
jgi:putative nucleotidyltransferase with HDIG domain